MIPGAVLPPSEEHSYAQWLKGPDHNIKATHENQENVYLKAQGTSLDSYLLTTDTRLSLLFVLL